VLVLVRVIVIVPVIVATHGISVPAS
jgi:hypothetical protein